MNDMPVEYEEKRFLEWFNREIGKGKDLAKDIEDFREVSKNKGREYIETFLQLASQIRNVSEREIKYQFNNVLVGKYLLPTIDNAKEFDRFFKPTKSIIEKLWRTFKDIDPNGFVACEFPKHIRDFVRTSVVCPSLYHASDFAKRLKNWATFISEEEKAQHFSKISHIEIDEEAKLNRGYFAFHGQVVFVGEFELEVQFFSQMTSLWRDISHSFYEASRVGKSPTPKPGSLNSRMVSIGHLLHIAELELFRIAEEIGEKG